MDRWNCRTARGADHTHNQHQTTPNSNSRSAPGRQSMGNSHLMAAKTRTTHNQKTRHREKQSSAIVQSNRKNKAQHLPPSPLRLYFPLFASILLKLTNLNINVKCKTTTAAAAVATKANKQKRNAVHCLIDLATEDPMQAVHWKIMTLLLRHPATASTWNQFVQSGQLWKSLFSKPSEVKHRRSVGSTEKRINAF